MKLRLERNSANGILFFFRALAKDGYCRCMTDKSEENCPRADEKRVAHQLRIAICSRQVFELACERRAARLGRDVDGEEIDAEPILERGGRSQPVKASLSCRN